MSRRRRIVSLRVPEELHDMLVIAAARDTAGNASRLLHRLLVDWLLADNPEEGTP
jgi:hypothetical protein